MFFLEYIWLDADNNFRTKVKTTQKKDVNLETLEQWDFDGSSTGQASGHDSEVIIKPYSYIVDNDKNNYYYVFCECYNPKGSPHKTNTRNMAFQFFEQYNIKALEPMFGIEQEFFVFKNGKPIIWDGENTEAQGNYYCGNGTKYINGREFLEQTVKKLIKMKINITGYNFEVAPGQMEIQICDKGIKVSDDLIMARFFLKRQAEMYYGWDIDFTPKPTFLGTEKWNGSGCHVNFSTNKIREPLINSPLSSLYETCKLIAKMKYYHTRDIDNFGSENNKLRLCGKNETSSYNSFTYGIANRGSSIRIPRTFVKNLKGYIEDRRPGSDMDPYITTQIICNYAIKDLNEIENYYSILQEINDNTHKIFLEIIEKHYNCNFS